MGAREGTRGAHKGHRARTRRRRGMGGGMWACGCMDDTARRGGRRRGMKRARGRSGLLSRSRQRVKMPLWIRPRLSEAFFGALAGKGSFLPFAAKTGALGKAGQKGAAGACRPLVRPSEGDAGNARGGVSERKRGNRNARKRTKRRHKVFVCRDSSPMATARNDCFWQGPAAPT